MCVVDFSLLFQIKVSQLVSQMNCCSCPLLLLLYLQSGQFRNKHSNGYLGNKTKQPQETDSNL